MRCHHCRIQIPVGSIFFILSSVYLHIIINNILSTFCAKKSSQLTIQIILTDSLVYMLVRGHLLVVHVHITLKNVLHVNSFQGELNTEFPKQCSGWYGEFSVNQFNKMCPEIDSKIVLVRHYEPVVSRWYHEANLFVPIICGHRTSGAMLQSLIGIVHVECEHRSSTGLSQYKTRELPHRCMCEKINEQTFCLWYARTMTEHFSFS